MVVVPGQCVNEGLWMGSWEEGRDILGTVFKRTIKSDKRKHTLDVYYNVVRVLWVSVTPGQRSPRRSCLKTQTYNLTTLANKSDTCLYWFF